MDTSHDLWNSLKPGDRVSVRYASSSLHGGSYTDTVTVKKVERDRLQGTGSDGRLCFYDRGTVVALAS
jgi:hypothetical protein